MVKMRRVFPTLIALVALALCGGRPGTTLATPKQMDLLWRKFALWPYLVTPATAGQSVYLMIEFGKLSEMSIADGHVIREVYLKQGGEVNGLLVDGGVLFLSRTNSNVSAFAIPSLDLLWSTYVVPPEPIEHPYWDLSAPAVDSSSVYFNSQDGNVYCLDRSSGQLRWKHQLPEISDTTPLVLDGAVYIADEAGHLSAIDPATGELVWRLQLDEQVEFADPKAVGSLIYIAGSWGSVFCIDPASRSVRWQRKVGAMFRNRISASERLICAADSTGVYGLDPATGGLRWRRGVGGEGPTEAHGHVYCFYGSHELAVLDVETGALLAEYPVGAAGFFDRPIVAGDRVVVAARNMVYCLADITD